MTALSISICNASSTSCRGTYFLGRCAQNLSKITVENHWKIFLLARVGFFEHRFFGFYGWLPQDSVQCTMYSVQWGWRGLSVRPASAKICAIAPYRVPPALAKNLCNRPHRVPPRKKKNLCYLCNLCAKTTSGGTPRDSVQCTVYSVQ